MQCIGKERCCKLPTNLDSCNGHTGPTPERPNGACHYHALRKFPNLPTCLSGVVAKNNFWTNARQGIGAQGDVQRVAIGIRHVSLCQVAGRQATYEQGYRVRVGTAPA